MPWLVTWLRTNWNTAVVPAAGASGGLVAASLGWGPVEAAQATLATAGAAGLLGSPVDLLLKRFEERPAEKRTEQQESKVDALEKRMGQMEQTLAVVDQARDSSKATQETMRESPNDSAISDIAEAQMGDVQQPNTEDGRDRRPAQAPQKASAAGVPPVPIEGQSVQLSGADLNARAAQLEARREDLLQRIRDADEQKAQLLNELSSVAEQEAATATAMRASQEPRPPEPAKAGPEPVVLDIQSPVAAPMAEMSPPEPAGGQPPPAEETPPFAPAEPNAHQTPERDDMGRGPGPTSPPAEPNIAVDPAPPTQAEQQPPPAAAEKSDEALVPWERAVQDREQLNLERYGAKDPGQVVAAQNPGLPADEMIKKQAEFESRQAQDHGATAQGRGQTPAPRPARTDEDRRGIED